MAWDKEHNAKADNKNRYTEIKHDTKFKKCHSDRDKNKEDLRTVCPSDYSGAKSPKYVEYKMTFPAANVWRRICHLNDGAHPKQASVRNRPKSELIMWAKNMVYTNSGANKDGTTSRATTRATVGRPLGSLRKLVGVHVPAGPLMMLPLLQSLTTSDSAVAIGLSPPPRHAAHAYEYYARPCKSIVQYL